MLTPLLIALVAGYVLGSLPFGYLVARSRGVNIFAVGSRNPGATNVRRVLGAGPGNLVFVLDALKGMAAAAGPRYALAGDPDYVAIAGLVGALLGHSFSCFTQFRGGKGVATAAGGLLILIEVPLLIAVAVWLVTFFASRYVSLASIFAALSLPVSVFLLNGRNVMLGLTVAIALFVIVRHRANVQRLFNGTEAKFARKPKTPSP